MSHLVQKYTLDQIIESTSEMNIDSFFALCLKFG